jgi:hypothetical protein
MLECGTTHSCLIRHYLEGSPSLSMRRRILVIIALFGLCTPASSQERCPELTRLNAEAEEALKKAAGLVEQDRCDAYVRYSVTWAEIAKIRA